MQPSGRLLLPSDLLISLLSANLLYLQLCPHPGLFPRSLALESLSPQAICLHFTFIFVALTPQPWPQEDQSYLAFQRSRDCLSD